MIDSGVRQTEAIASLIDAGRYYFFRHEAFFMRGRQDVPQCWNFRFSRLRKMHASLRRGTFRHDVAAIFMIFRRLRYLISF